jgi:hypothetical protein
MIRKSIHLPFKVTIIIRFLYPSIGAFLAHSVGYKPIYNLLTGDLAAYASICSLMNS